MERLDTINIDKAILKLNALKEYYQTHDENECLDYEIALLKSQLGFWGNISTKYPNVWNFVKDYKKCPKKAHML